MDTAHQGHRPGLLVSVRSPEEARAALDGGADLIDIKEPAQGSLGRASDSMIQAIVDCVAGRRPVSAACGELMDRMPMPSSSNLAFVKWGLAGCGEFELWRGILSEGAHNLRIVMSGCEPVAACYVDWQRAAAPPPFDVVRAAKAADCGTILFDTWKKDGRNLLDWLSPAEVAALCQNCRELGLKVALAGSLQIDAIQRLDGIAPDWFAVRGAACKGGDRDAWVDSERVRRLAAILQQDSYQAAESSPL